MNRTGWGVGASLATVLTLVLGGFAVAGGSLFSVLRPVAAQDGKAASARSGLPQARATSWDAPLSARAAVGHIETVRCPDKGTAHTVYGASPYTADSSVCTAAVHSGLITLRDGGVVQVRSLGPQPLFGSSEAHGVASWPYGPYRSSFDFVRDGKSAGAGTPAQAVPLRWESGAFLPSAIGARYTFLCPAHGKAGTVYGTDLYTYDTPPCSAGAHAGVIDVVRGGLVVVEVRGPHTAFKGSERHGVLSYDWSAARQSFVITAVDAQH
jgi:hypothetical protein